jgi:serine/threonine-protein kinase
VRLEGRNGAQLTATLADDSVLGKVTVAEKQLPFAAAVAGPPAGIYEGEATVDGKPNRIGWIVLPSGRQVGINNVAGNRGPAPELDPNDIDGFRLRGVEVEVQRIGGADPVVPR